MKIGRRGFLASLIAAPVLARMVGVEKVVAIDIEAPHATLAYLYSVEGFPRLRANVYGVGRPLTEELLLQAIGRCQRPEREERYRKYIGYGMGAQWTR